jgi:hypothetical protein
MVIIASIKHQKETTEGGYSLVSVWIRYNAIEVLSEDPVGSTHDHFVVYFTYGMVEEPQRPAKENEDSIVIGFAVDGFAQNTTTNRLR